MIADVRPVTRDPDVWRRWLPELGLAAATLVIGLVEWLTAAGPLSEALLLVGVLTAASVACARHLPGVSLALVWVCFAVQLGFGVRMLTVQLVVGVVAFGCTRWGSRTVVVLSGLSIPVAAGIALIVFEADGRGALGVPGMRGLVDRVYVISDSLAVGGATLAVVVVVVPWLSGLVLRSVDRANASEVQQHAAELTASDARQVAAQARDIARLQEEQARLARDVHDVVGHSLAVILAQAESAQFLPDDSERLKGTLATIATSARSSLQEVREVLSATNRPVARPGWLEELVEGVRAGGREVHVDEVGTPQPLPPDLEVVAQRVLQEMLTNAVKHGDRAVPITVERHWPSASFERDLRIEVRNAIPVPGTTDPIADPSDGQGLGGMERRLEAVGGRLDVRRREDADGATFAVTAWLPVSRLV